VRLTWSPLAVADRIAIYQFIEADSPRSAILVDDRIWNATLSLSRFPEIGRPGRIAGTRELVVQRTPYLVAYRIQDDGLRILRVLHGAQRWPRRLPHR
jgi:toxin ParE1/3/4